MPRGGTLRISAHNQEIDESSTVLLPPGQYLRVAIADRGHGIAEENVAMIFDPYFSTKPAASGLGLAISYSIVKKHGGLLQLESTSTEGSTFVFYLPAMTSAPVAPPSLGPEQAALPPAQQRRILIMDDEDAIRELTAQLLETLGYEVTAVPDGAEAIRTYESAMQSGQSYQAVILDATVRGGVGGVATIERLRRLDPKVNAIICSGYSDEAALSEFLAYGFRGALPKPFTRDELADALQALLGPNE